MERRYRNEGKQYIGVGGGVLIFNDKKEVLLMRRSKGARNEADLWSKPGGTVEYGEKVHDALAREIKEELNINIEMVGYLPHVDHIISHENQHWVAFNYVGQIVGGDLKNQEPEKCSAVKWFPLDALPEKLTQTTREPIQNYIAGKYILL